MKYSKKTLRTSAERLEELACCCCTTSDFPSYIKELKAYAADKRITNSLAEVITSDNKLEELKKLVEKEEQLKGADTSHATIELNQGIAFVDALYNPPDSKSRIYTGMRNVDGTLCGLRKKSISMIGAHPSVGKTALALNIIQNQIKDRLKTLFFSLEMSAGQIYERLCTCILGISYGKFNRQSLTEQEKKSISDYIITLSSSGLLFIRDDINTIEGITRTIAEVKPDLVVIDFINLIHTIQRTNSRREEIDYISYQIKTAAKRYDCHIITLSQLARASKDSQKTAPTMSDLKESGGLEQDNDYIMILNRPYVYDKTHAPTEAALLIDKNKYGNTGVQKLYFDGDHQRFREVAYERE